MLNRSLFPKRLAGVEIPTIHMAKRQGFAFFTSSVIFCSQFMNYARIIWSLPSRIICITHSRALNADLFPYCRFSGRREATTRYTSQSQVTGLEMALFGCVFTGLRSLLACGLRNISGRLCSPPERSDDRKYVCLHGLEAYWSKGNILPLISSIQVAASLFWVRSLWYENTILFLFLKGYVKFCTSDHFERKGFWNSGVARRHYLNMLL